MIRPHLVTPEDAGMEPAGPPLGGLDVPGVAITPLPIAGALPSALM